MGLDGSSCAADSSGGGGVSRQGLSREGGCAGQGERVGEASASSDVGNSVGVGVRVGKRQLNRARRLAQKEERAARKRVAAAAWQQAEEMVDQRAKAEAETRRVEWEIRTARRVHANLGHLSPTGMRELLHQRPHQAAALGLTERGIDGLSACADCARGKQKSTAFRRGDAARPPDEVPLNAVWSWDVFHPSSEPGEWGEGLVRYVLLGVEHTSRLIVVHFTSEKSEASQLLLDHVAWAGRVHPSQPVREMRTDGAGEFVSRALRRQLAEVGVEKVESPPYVPQMNGKAERAGGVVAATARTMLLASGLPERFWPLAWHAAVHVRNRLPMLATSTRRWRVPFEEYFGRPVQLADMRAFGARCFVHVPAARRRGKMAPRAWEGRLVGYASAPRTYLVLNMYTDKVVITRDVVFDNKEIVQADWPALGMGSRDRDDDHDTVTGSDVEEHATDHRELNHDTVSGSGDGSLLASDSGSSAPLDSPAPWRAAAAALACSPAVTDGGGYTADARLSWRDVDADGRELAEVEGVPFDDSMRVAWRACVAATGRERQASELQGDPGSHGEVMKRPTLEREEWLAAERVEWQSVLNANVGEFVLRTSVPSHKRVLPCVWAYKTKLDEAGRIIKRKARLAAGGHRQVKGLDWSESYAPTGAMSSTRIAASVAAARGMVSRQFDVVAAYLNSPLAEEIYMEVPESFRQEHPGMVLRLRKALYGLVQGAAAWWKLLRGVMQKAGWRESKVDEALYVRTDGERRGWVASHVDDLPVYATDEQMIEELKQVLTAHFPVTDDGPVSYVCGVEYRPDGFGRVHASQKAYAERVLQRYGMSDCAPRSTPMAVGERPRLCDCPLPGSEEALEMAKVPYRAAVGSLMYLVVGTRPDIAAAVSECARFCANPGRAHWAAVKRILQYVKGTLDLGIVLGAHEDKPLVLEAFVDADYADSDDRKSTSGFVVFLGGAPVVWSSKRQVGKTKLSSAEAELVALRDVCKELSYLRQLVVEFGVSVDSPVVVKEDNQAVLHWVVGHGVGRLKHIDVALHYARDCVTAKEIRLQHVKSAEQVADLLTKPLPGPAYSHLVAKLGMAARWD